MTRRAQVVAPGVIVSTLIDEHGRAETVTFTRGLPRRPGFDVRVIRDDRASNAPILHAIAVAVATETTREGAPT